jgi:hypothetical protein
VFNKENLTKPPSVSIGIAQYMFWNELQPTCLTIFCVFICRHVSLDGYNERHGRRVYGDFGMWVSGKIGKRA